MSVSTAHHHLNTTAHASPASQSVHLPAPEVSQFSPISQEFPMDPSPSKPKWSWGPPRSADVERGFEDTRSKPLPPKARRKFTDMLFQWRVGMFNHAPRPAPTFETWGPPPEWKTTTSTSRAAVPDPQQKKSRKRWLWILLVLLLLLFFFINIIYIDVRIANGSFGSTVVQSGSVDGPNGLTFETTQCLFQYNLSAPFAPKSFPCATCLPRMQALPKDYADSHAQDAQIALESVQFCGLQALFTSAGETGGAALEKVGWMQDNRYCTWSGVTCDGTGSVSTLEMVFPAIPATIPDDVGVLSSLQSLSITGDRNIPSGALPKTLARATNMNTFKLTQTALTGPIDDVLLAAWTGLRTLSLVSNSKMGTSLPYYLGQNAIETLIVQQQGLTEFILVGSSIMASSLTTLDLTANALTGPVFALFGAFNALTTLRLGDNDFTGPLPALPKGLQTLDLNDNPRFGGFTLPAALCSSAALTNCDMTDTGFSANTTCGVCKF
ncbi:L domain-like protein [Auricularia subglabra TFB-10046 SS5]|nr:L domain-like protein [Auricularia subglabra TFB-10046 SS5]